MTDATTTARASAETVAELFAELAAMHPSLAAPGGFLFRLDGAIGEQIAAAEDAGKRSLGELPARVEALEHAVELVAHRLGGLGFALSLDLA